MKTILFTANTAWNLSNFRAGIIDALIARGDRVVAVATDEGAGDQLRARGCVFEPVAIDSKGINPLKDVRLLNTLRRVYARHNPDIVLQFTIKPVIYGTLAARLNGLRALNTITGLGTVFIRQGPVTRVAETLYRLSIAGSNPVIFQNSDDLALFRQRRLVSSNPLVLVPGSGVDLQTFPKVPLPKGQVVCFLLVARLIRDKGVYEFVEAARRIKRLNKHTRFKILGPAGVANRTAVPDQALQSWIDDGLVDYLGDSTDVHAEMARADCIVLPSYREGLSRVLLEASAIGRPMITTNVPGCRDVVEDGLNGFLCEPRDADDLAGALQRFLDMDYLQRGEMAEAARERAETRYDSRIVVRQYLDLIDDLTAD